MRLKRWALLLFLMVLAAVSCTQESARKPVGGAAVTGGGSAGTVDFAEIVSPGFRSDQPLTVHFTTKQNIQRIEAFRYTWYVNGSPASGITGNVLDPKDFRRGDAVQVEVTPSDGATMGTPFRSESVTIKNSPPVMTSVGLRPIPAFAGDTITVSAEASDVDGDAVSYSYQWLVNDKKVPGGEQGTFPTAGLKKKDTITAIVTPFDGTDRGQEMYTNSLALSDRVPDITSTPPSGLQDGVFVYQVIAKDPDGDPVTYALDNAPTGMTIDGSSGMIRWTPTGTPGERQSLSVKISVSDNDGGVAFQEFTLNIELK